MNKEYIMWKMNLDKPRKTSECIRCYQSSLPNFQLHMTKNISIFYKIDVCQIELFDLLSIHSKIFYQFQCLFFKTAHECTMINVDLNSLVVSSGHLQTPFIDVWFVLCFSWSLQTRASRPLWRWCTVLTVRACPTWSPVTDTVWTWWEVA